MQNLNNSKEVEKIIEEQYKKRYEEGIRVGAIAVSRVILDKLNDESKTFAQRIIDVKRFCRIPLENASEETK